MTKTSATTARALYDAYSAKDREAAEVLIAADFRFTSPCDNGIDRERYFAICWPTSENNEGSEIMHMIEHEDRVFVNYEGRTDKARFCNTEILTILHGQITAIEVYFGWNVPHDVPAGEHRDPP